MLLDAWNIKGKLLYCKNLKLTQFIRGWVNYFGMANMKSLLLGSDEWLRHRIRAIYLLLDWYIEFYISFGIRCDFVCIKKDVDSIVPNIEVE